MPVRLKDIVGELGCIPPGAFVWISRKTGELVFGTDEDLRTVEDEWDDLNLDGFPEWQRKALQTLNAAYESGDFVKLPSQFEIHDWQIMRNFCDTLDDGPKRDALLSAVHGKGAFRYFKDTLDRQGLKDAWHQFHDEALEEIAIAFLDRHGIPWTR